MFMPTHQRRRLFRPSPTFLLFVLIESLFWGLAATCLLFALHRIASALKMEARLEALKQMPDAFTEEEREILVHKVKTRALHVS